MTDLALVYDPDAHAADLSVVDGDLALDGGLGSLGLAQLLTDARATPGDLAFGGIDPRETDLRGWWGDALSDGPMGSKLWTLARVKATDEARRRARDFARAALAWWIGDGIAAAIDVTATREDGVGSGARLVLFIEAERPGAGREVLRFDLLWRAML